MIGHPRALVDAEGDWLVHSLTDVGVYEMVESGALESYTPIDFGPGSWAAHSRPFFTQMS